MRHLSPVERRARLVSSIASLLICHPGLILVSIPVQTFLDKDYRSGRGLKGKRALVVGFGNSGAEMALDLWEWGAKPAVSVPADATTLREQLPSSHLRLIFRRAILIQNIFPSFVRSSSGLR